jgi:hypothetical protein
LDFDNLDAYLMLHLGPRHVRGLGRHQKGETRMARVSARFWLETIVGILSIGLMLVTLVWPDWLELVVHIDPDSGSGAAEWAVVALLAVIALASFGLARVEWRKAHLASAH